MLTVSISLKDRKSEGLTRLADSLTRTIAQSDDTLRALGLPRDFYVERLGYVNAELQARYNCGCDAHVKKWVEDQWFGDDDVNVAQLALVA